MRLTNFDLAEPVTTTSVVAGDQEIDLHNEWIFVGIKIHPDLDLLSIEFKKARAKLPVSLRLNFRGLRSFNWSKRGGEGGADWLLDVSKAIPGEDAFPMKDEWAKDEDCDLLFNTGSGSFRVSCETAELELPK